MALEELEKNFNEISVKSFLNFFDRSIDRLDDHILNDSDNYGETSLYFATEKYIQNASQKIRLEIIKFLLKKSDPNLINYLTLISPFHLICKRETIEIELIREFIKNKADINLRDNVLNFLFFLLFNKTNKKIFFFQNNKNSSFHFLCKNNNISYEQLKILFMEKANPNMRNQKEITPFFNILNNPKIDLNILKLFIKYKADLNGCDKKGNTILSMLKGKETTNNSIISFMIKNESVVIEGGLLGALERDENENVKFLLVHSADPELISSSHGDQNYLHMACSKPELDATLLNALFTQKNLSSYDSSGKLPIHYLCKNESVDLKILRLFMMNGCELNASLKNKQRNGFHYLLKNRNISNESAIYFLKKGEELNLRDYTGKTPFYYALENENISPNVLKIFLSRGADINSCDNQGRTILQRQKQAFSKTMSTFFEKNLAVQIDGALQGAIQRKEFGNVDFLLRHSASPNLIFEDGNCALHHACILGNENLIVSLLSYKADPSLKSPENRDFYYLFKDNLWLLKENYGFYCFSHNNFYLGLIKDSLPHGTGKRIHNGKVIFSGEWKYGKEFIGTGKYTFKYYDMLSNDKEDVSVWEMEGKISQGNPADGKIFMTNLLKDETYSGTMKEGMRYGSGILIEEGKEFYVEYDENGFRKLKKRTFEGMRLMIVGKNVLITSFFKIYFLKINKIGNRDVGKTSFKTRIKNVYDEKRNKSASLKVQQEKREENMTHGVEIDKWINKTKDSIFTLWDFAGHEGLNFLIF